jgi:hypothetical protein
VPVSLSTGIETPCGCKEDKLVYTRLILHERPYIVRNVTDERDGISANFRARNWWDKQRNFQLKSAGLCPKCQGETVCLPVRVLGW